MYQREGITTKLFKYQPEFVPFFEGLNCLKLAFISNRSNTFWIFWTTFKMLCFFVVIFGVIVGSAYVLYSFLHHVSNRAETTKERTSNLVRATSINKMIKFQNIAGAIHFFRCATVNELCNLTGRYPQQNFNSLIIIGGFKNHWSSLKFLPKTRNIFINVFRKFTQLTGWIPQNHRNLKYFNYD